MASAIADRIEFFLRAGETARKAQQAHGVGIGTSRGPRDDNQDRAAVAQLTTMQGDRILIAIICDGMGGMSSGAAAASCAVSYFITSILTARHQSLGGMVLKSVSSANRAVYDRFGGNGGTTLTALVVRDGEEPYVAHVGDSRLYMKSIAGELELITKDDTILGQIKPNINEDDLDNRLLQFVGIGSDLEPHVFQLPAAAGYEFVLTTDGAHSIGKRSLNGIVGSSSSSLDIVRKILYVTEAIGTADNASAIALRLDNLEYFPRFGRGLEARIWTSSDKIEIWLNGEMQEEDAGHESLRQKELEWRSSVKASALKRIKSARSSNKQRKPQSKNTTSSPSKKPQLYIEFNKDDKDEGQ